MEDQAALLARVANALERLAPAAPPSADWLSAPAYAWNGSFARAIDAIDAPPLDLLKGIDRQKATIAGNVQRLAEGMAAHDMLLWGARGMGKSALVRSAVKHAQEKGGHIALVQVTTDAVATLGDLFAQIGAVKRNFLVYIDDLGFAEDDAVGPRHLRSWLDGGVEARPANCRLAVTSNRRAILPRQANEQDDPINPRDVVDDQLALADRFGLSLGFHNCTQDEYLNIVAAYAAHLGLSYEREAALEWAKRRGSRSGRVARHFITELAGQAGRNLT